MELNHNATSTSIPRYSIKFQSRIAYDKTKRENRTSQKDTRRENFAEIGSARDRRSDTENMEIRTCVSRGVCRTRELPIRAVIAHLRRASSDAPAAAARNGSAGRIRAQTIISLINPVGLAQRLIIRCDVKATLVDTRISSFPNGSTLLRDLAAPNIPPVLGSRPIKRSFCATASRNCRVDSLSVFAPWKTDISNFRARRERERALCVR